MNITIASILDKRYCRKKDQKFRLAIRVTYNRIPMPYPLDLYVTEEEYLSFSKPRIRRELGEIRDDFIDAERRARKIVKSLGTFTFDAFREQFYIHKRESRKRMHSGRKTAVDPVIMPNSAEGKNLKYGKRRFDRVRSNVNYDIMGPLGIAFGEYIKILELQGRIGTSESYFTSLNSLLSFKRYLRFEDITKQFLYEYEKWMADKGVSMTTVGIYLRNLRAIYNIEIAEGRLPEQSYPFGKRKYVIPTGVRVKKALDLKDIKAH